MRHSDDDDDDEEEASEGPESSEEVCSKSVGAGAEQRLTHALRSGAALGAKPGGMQE